MNAFRSVGWTGAAVLLLAGFAGTAQTTSAKHNDLDPKQISALLLDAKTMAVQAEDDAMTMESYTQTSIPWGEHASEIAQIEEHVMALNRQATELKAAEGTAEPWQKTVIERIEPYLGEMAKDNQSVIDETDKHPSLFGTPAWNAFVQANASSAAYLGGLIVNFVNNGTIRQNMRDYDQPEDTCGLSGVANRWHGRKG
jgi:hypothetical protein